MLLLDPIKFPPFKTASAPPHMELSVSAMPSYATGRTSVGPAKARPGQGFKLPSSTSSFWYKHHSRLELADLRILPGASAGLHLADDSNIAVLGWQLRLRKSLNDLCFRSLPAIICLFHILAVENRAACPGVETLEHLAVESFAAVTH